MGIWVVALGGNAILQPKQKGTVDGQWRNVTAAAEQVLQLRAQGHQVIVTHGNGPQVGSILKQQELAAAAIPPMPLDICGAQTQGMLGYMLQHSLNVLLAEQHASARAIALVTQVIVDADDPAFMNPSKPVGSFAAETVARKRMAAGETWVEDAGRGWRRVVASPLPQRILNLEAIRSLVEQGFLVIAAGGGGIPTVTGNRFAVPPEAVIDKDRTAALLATNMEASGLLILTDVEYVCLNYRTPQEQPLKVITTEEAQRYLEAGHFQRGSMGPKVEAVVSVARSGGTGIIGRLDQAAAAMAGNTGTQVVP